MSQSIKIYAYSACSTCKKALKFLNEKNIAFEKVAIVEQPPTLAELKRMLQHLKDSGLSFKNLFNTSGVQYRELKISEKINAGMSEADALKLLAKNGKLIRRPFLLTANGGTVGFRPADWSKLLRN